MLGKISDFFKSMFEKDSVLKVVSIIAAVIIWASVSISVYPTMDKVVYNVPVSISLENTYAQSNQLDIISCSDETVTVNITGERGKIGDITAEDLTAVVDVSNVMMPREYGLSMNIESASGKNFEVISIDPPTISVVFDKIITKQFEVVPEVENVSIAAGYISGEPIISPSAVTVRGPQDMVDSITKVCAKAAVDKELSSTYEFSTNELVFFNDDAVISNDNQMLTYDKTSFAIKLPVYVRQTLPLEVNIINAPDNFDLDSFREKLVFSANELNIAAPNDKIKELTSLNIGTINMREVDIGKTFDFKAENFLPADYENLSQIDTVTVTCPSEGLAKKPIPIMGKEIQFVNRPAQFEFKPVASGMTLSLVGDAEEIASITKEDVTAQIDLIDFDMKEGDYRMAVDFIISSYNNVWFIGDDGIATPKIIVTAELIDEEESE